MRVELPVFKRCCCCIPLRLGLLGWGYFNVAVNAAACVYLILLLYTYYVIYVAVCLFIVILAIEVAFNIVLLVACHKKSAKLLKTSYIYCIIFLLFLLAGAAFTIYVELERTYQIQYWSLSTSLLRLLLTLTPLFSNIFVQVYVTLLIRSEMIKLRNQSLEMQFVNHAADGEARCVRAGLTDIEKEKAEA